MVNRTINFDEDIIHISKVFFRDIKKIVSALAQSKVLAKSKVQNRNTFLSLVSDPDIWNTVKWRKLQTHQESRFLQGNTVTITEAIENDLFAPTAFIHYVRNRDHRSAYSAKCRPNDAQDMEKRALDKTSVLRPVITDEYKLYSKHNPPITDNESVPELRQNNSAQIKYVHEDDSITVPSTAMDSYITFDDDPDELSLFDVLDR